MHPLKHKEREKILHSVHKVNGSVKGLKLWRQYVLFFPDFSLPFILLVVNLLLLAGGVSLLGSNTSASSDKFESFLNLFFYISVLPSIALFFWLPLRKDIEWRLLDSTKQNNEETQSKFQSNKDSALSSTKRQEPQNLLAHKDVFELWLQRKKRIIKRKKSSLSLGKDSHETGVFLFFAYSTFFLILVLGNAFLTFGAYFILAVGSFGLGQQVYILGIKSENIKDFFNLSLHANRTFSFNTSTEKKPFSFFAFLIAFFASCCTFAFGIRLAYLPTDHFFYSYIFCLSYFCFLVSIGIFKSSISFFKFFEFQEEPLSTDPTRLDEVSTLIGSLESPYSKVRRVAVMELAAKGREAEEAIPFLKKATTDLDIRVQEEAKKALSQIENVVSI